MSGQCQLGAWEVPGQGECMSMVPTWIAIACDEYVCSLEVAFKSFLALCPSMDSNAAARSWAPFRKALMLHCFHQIPARIYTGEASR